MFKYSFDKCKCGKSFRGSLAVYEGVKSDQTIHWSDQHQEDTKVKVN